MIIKDEKPLREISTEVTSIEDAVDITKYIMDEIIKIGGESTALGLAAPQVGIKKRVFVAWGSSGESKTEQWNIYVNPILEEVLSDSRMLFVEGCLSFPASDVRTNRHDEILVSYLDIESGERVRCVLYGRDAIVFQHELDHLDGILFFDRVAKSAISQVSSWKNPVGRNEPCPCSSSKKYKKCCGK